MKRSKMGKNEQIMIYCFKCKEKTPTNKPHLVTMSNGRRSITGSCSICGTKKFQFVSEKDGNGLLGNLLGLPNGRVPVLSDLPLVGGLF
jgi:hypothetical protein